LINGSAVTIANFTIFDGSFSVHSASGSNAVGGPTTLRYLSSGFTEIGGKLQLYRFTAHRISVSALKWFFADLAITGVELYLGSSVQLNYSGSVSIERLHLSGSVVVNSSDGSLSIGRLTSEADVFRLASYPATLSASLLYVWPFSGSTEGYGRLIANGQGRPTQKFYLPVNAADYNPVEAYLAENLKISVGRWGYLVSGGFRVGGAGDLLVRLTSSSAGRVISEASGNVTVHWFAGFSGGTLNVDYALPTATLKQVDDIISASAIGAPEEPPAALEEDNTVRDLSVSILVVMIVLTIVVVVFIILCSKRGGDADA
jgi:hypothetical protein